MIATVPAVAVELEECFLQCAKAIIRSKLWEPQERPDFESLPSAAEMLVNQVQMPEFDVAKMQTLLDGAYKNSLYRDRVEGWNSPCDSAS